MYKIIHVSRQITDLVSGCDAFTIQIYFPTIPVTCMSCKLMFVPIHVYWMTLVLTSNTESVYLSSFQNSSL